MNLMKVPHLPRAILIPLLLWGTPGFCKHLQQKGAPKVQEAWEEAIDLYQYGEFREAAPILEQEASRLLRTERPKTAATAFNYAGLAKTFLGDYESARADLQRAKDIFDKAQDPGGVTLALVSFGVFYREQGLGREAFASYEDARAALLEGEERIGGQRFSQLSIAIESGLGAVYLEQGSYGQSLDILENIHSSLHGDFPFEEAEVRTNLAIVYSLVEKNEQAAEELPKAYGHYLDLEDKFGQAEVRTVTAWLLARQGSYTSALEEIDQADKSFQDLGLVVSHARAGLLRGRLMLELDNFDEAETEAKSAQKLFEAKTNAAGTARALLLLGQVYYAQSGDADTQEARGRYLKKAEITLNDAMQRFISLSLIGDLVETHNTLGAVAFDLGGTGNISAAEEHFNSGLTLTQVSKDARRAAESLLGLGELAAVGGNEDRAVRYLEDARSKALESTSPLVLTAIEMNLVAIYQKHEENKKVLVLLRQVILRLRDLIRTGKVSAATRAFREKQSDLLENALLVLSHFQKLAGDAGQPSSLAEELSDVGLGRTYAEIAFNLAEMAKGVASTEIYAASQLRLGGANLPDDIRQKEEAYQKRLETLKHIVAESYMGETTTESRKSRMELAKEEEDFEQFKFSLRTHPDQRVRAYAWTRYPQTLLMKDISLNQNEALLVFKVIDTHTLIWVITADRMVTGMTPRISRRNHSTFDQLVQGLRQGQEASNGIEEYSKEVCQQLKLPGLLKDIPEGTLLHVVPDGFLYHLPLEALDCSSGNRSELLGGRFNFIYHPSATVFAMNRTSQSYSKNWEVPLLAFARPHQTRYIGLGRPEYPEMEETARNVARELGLSDHDTGSVRVGLDASESFLKQLDKSGELIKFRYILFATHGYGSSEEANGESALVLSNGNGEDGLLVYDEAVSLHLDSDLIFLSTCESGISGTILKTEGVLSLAKALELAGAKSVIASLWQVDAGATEYLTERFFFHLVLERHPKYKALDLARKDLATTKEYAHPHYWASFVLVGQP